MIEPASDYPLPIFYANRKTFRDKMKLSATMEYYLLKGERNLSLSKAKEVARLTTTDVLLWLDPARAEERREAWAKLGEKEGK